MRLPTSSHMRVLASSCGARLLMAAGAVALIIGAANSPGAAAGWTVSPGGLFTGRAGRTELADTTTGQAAIFCASSSSRGTLKSGSGLAGAGVGTVKAMSFRGGCFTLTAGLLPWKISARSYQPGAGTTVGTITGVHLRFTDPAFCDFSADGTGAAAGNETVRFRYVNGTGTLQILRTGSTLHIYGVKGCGGAFHDGDTAALSSTSMITPVQTITGP
jgi:hypothetical protein